jgi:hypothetical protein
MLSVSFRCDIGRLPEHFAGNNHSGPAFLHNFLRFFEHQDFAVNARVKYAPETVLRDVFHHGDEIVADIHGGYGKAVRLFPERDAAGVVEKGHRKMQAFDGKPLVLYQSGGYYAVQAAGKKGDHVVGGIFHGRHTTSFLSFRNVAIALAQ